LSEYRALALFISGKEHPHTQELSLRFGALCQRKYSVAIAVRVVLDGNIFALSKYSLNEIFRWS